MMKLRFLTSSQKKKLELPTRGTGVPSVALVGANPKWTLSRFYNFLWGSIRLLYLLMIMHLSFKVSKRSLDLTVLSSAF